MKNLYLKPEVEAYALRPREALLQSSGENLRRNSDLADQYDEDDFWD